MSEELEGCQYGICCNSDKYFKLQQENTQLKRMLNIKENLDKKETTYEWNFEDMFDMREENTLLQQQLKDKDEKISKTIEYMNKCICSQDTIAHFLSHSEVKKTLEILESE